MRHSQHYARRQHAVSFVGDTRSLTITLPREVFERFEKIAIERDIPNSTLGRQIILQFLKRCQRGH